MKATHHLKIEPSPYFAGLLTVAATIAGLAIVSSGLAIGMTLALIAVLIATTLYCIRNDGFARPAHQITGIYWSEEQKSGDSWVLELATGRQIPAALDENRSTLGGRVVSLVFRWREGRPRRLTALLLPGSAPPEDLRRLRLVLNALH